MEPLTISILSAAIYGFFLWRHYNASDKKVTEMTEKIKELSTELIERNKEIIETTEKLEKVEEENYPILNTFNAGTIYPINIFTFCHAYHSNMIDDYSEIRNLIAREYLLDKVYKFKTASEKYVYFFFSVHITETFHFMKKRHIFNIDLTCKGKAKHRIGIGAYAPYALYMTDDIKDILECQPLMDVLSEEDKIALLFFGEGIEEISDKKCFKIKKQQIKPHFKTAWDAYMV